MGIPTDDLKWMIRDSGGVPVLFGTQSTYGHFDKVDVAILENHTGITGADWQVIVPNTALTGLLQDSAITVNGTAYTIRKHMQVDTDMTVILLANV